MSWDDQGVAVATGGKTRWESKEHLLYRPDYLERMKSYILVTDATEGKFHISVVDRTGKVLTNWEISGGQAGIPAVIPCSDTIAFADPGVFARAPIVGENNPSWLDARKQLIVLGFNLTKGTVRWQIPELSIGQPLAASGAYLWTVRLTNPTQAYAGAKPLYEIDQVGGYSGKIVRTWMFGDAGIDLASFRWRAVIRGTSCFLHRLEAWPDANTVGNSAPADFTLTRIVGGAKIKGKRKAIKKKS